LSFPYSLSYRKKEKMKKKPRKERIREKTGRGLAINEERIREKIGKGTIREMIGRGLDGRSESPAAGPEFHSMAK
jgi:hypothetical protein